MVFLKKILFVLSLFLIQVQGVFAATSGISNLFERLGGGFLDIYNSEQATYFFLIAGLFWALFVLIHSGLQKVPHLSGKPAKVIAFTVTFMGVTLLVFGKSASEVISLFKGSVGFIFALIFGGIIIASSIWISKKFKDKLHKTIFISTGIYIGTSFIIPIFDQFFNLVNKHLVDGAAANLGSILGTINGGAGLVAFVSLAILIGKGLNIREANKSPEQKNRNSIKRNLQKIMKESKNSVNIHNKLAENLNNLKIHSNKLNESQGRGTSSSSIPGNTEGLN